MLQAKIKEFFDSNPEASEVHSALGVLFTDKGKAQTYLGGVKGQEVETHTRETAAAPSAQTTETGGAGGSSETTGEVKKDATAAAGPDAPGDEVKEPLTPAELEAGHDALAQGKPLTEKKKASEK